MNARKYILEKQIQWAKNRDVKLIGSKGNRGQQAYYKCRFKTVAAGGAV